ncbi:MAG TPA: TonB-dependent receptor [Bryobacteraceae bacterium]|nr:TonB-dependent receptor [Bryobacteraceae bacterium]
MEGPCYDLPKVGYYRFEGLNMRMRNVSSFRGCSLPGLLASFFLYAVAAFPQSTGTIQGTVTDATGAAVPNASISVKNQQTGEERSTSTDSSGIYSVPSLPVGGYTVSVKSPGMSPMNATNVVVAVSSTVRQDFSLKVATSTEVIEVAGAAPVIDTNSVSVGDVVNQSTVQEIPLNGRHFVDLALLIPGSVVPPANGFLTAPLRGQGSFAFNSAGARETSVNFMVNGINLSDPSQNQITFQPTINTVEEFKVDNSTFSAEYGRNSGSIVNIATRPGVDQWHGEAYEFLRNNYLDARNFSNPRFVGSGGVLTPNPQSPFKRNQFGADGGGAIVKDKTFVFLTFESTRQRQAVPLSSTTLSADQRAQATASSDALVQKLLPLIPLPNSGTNQFVASAVAPVNIEQGTANFRQVFSEKQQVNVYYAIQRDERNEPPSTDGNSFPGGGDQRNGSRQLLTINDTWAINPTMVNEARLGYNRIHITFVGDNTDSAAAFGINSGVTAAIGLPQITVSGAFTFGGIGGFPQGRGDNVGVLSDTLSWIHGNHSIKIGGEFRRQNSDNFSFTPGTFTFPSITAFLADQATGFSVNTSNLSNRTYGNSVGAFFTDTWKVLPRLTLSLGLRYDWYGTPTEAQNRFVVFDPTTDSLVHVGQGGGPSLAYNQSSLNFEPRVGIAWDPFGKGRTVVRAAYAIMTDQPTLGLVTGLVSNPPLAFPISFSPSAATPFVTLANAYSFAGGTVAPFSVAHGYKDAYVSEWNFNIEQRFGETYGLTVGYMGNKGSDLNIERNYNQPINGVRPFPTLSASSPIDPGLPLSNIAVYESVGNSIYNAGWIELKKVASKGLTLDASYTFSRSIDDNSRVQQGLTVQDSYNIHGDRGLSDFDVRHHFVLSSVYQLPFKGNRLKEGWELSIIETAQTGNPINFHISNASFAGAAVLRPDVTGPAMTGFTPGTNGSATTVTYVQNPSVFLNQGTTPGTVLGFGNLGRNVVIGPGFLNTDFALTKFTHLHSSQDRNIDLVVRADVFDIFNQKDFTQPNSVVGSSVFGLITGGTRFPAGDFGTSRQIQLSMKLQF